MRRHKFLKVTEDNLTAVYQKVKNFQKTKMRKTINSEGFGYKYHITAETLDPETGVWSNLEISDMISMGMPDFPTTVSLYTGIQLDFEMFRGLNVEINHFDFRLTIGPGCKVFCSGDTLIVDTILGRYTVELVERCEGIWLDGTILNKPDSRALIDTYDNLINGVSRNYAYTLNGYIMKLSIDGYDSGDEDCDGDDFSQFILEKDGSTTLHISNVEVDRRDRARVGTILDNPNYSGDTKLPDKDDLLNAYLKSLGLDIVPTDIPCTPIISESYAKKLMAQAEAEIVELSNDNDIDNITDPDQL